MMRKNLWMLAAILICGTMTMLTSCSENDNPVVPPYVQLCKELGNYGYDLSWIEHLLTPEEIYFITLPMNPATYGVTYDNGKYVKEFLEGMKQSTCNMMFVYGMQDPWTGGQIPDDKMGVNSRKLFIRNGTHNDFIDMWNQSEKTELFKWLDSLGFDMGK